VKNYTVQLDSEKLGYDLTAVVECAISGGMMVEAGARDHKAEKRLGRIQRYGRRGRSCDWQVQ